MRNEESLKDDLSLLGNQGVKYPDDYDPNVLELLTTNTLTMTIL